MILPVTYISVLLLLITSSICLGSWANTFKAAGARWRFELYSIDFAIGMMILLLAAACTLGMLGSDLPFSDRILVAGRTAQMLAIIAGGVFNLGNMLLLAAVSLLGLSTAFPLGIGVALIVSSCFHLRPATAPYLAAGIVLLIIAAVLEMRSARLRERAAGIKKTVAPAPATVARPVAAGGKPATATLQGAAVRSSKAIQPPKPNTKRSRRGMLAAIIGGMALGCFPPVLENCIPGDLGLGAYAGMVLFGLGVLVSTIVYNFYFLNITIDGSPLSFGAYFKGNASQHFLGFGGGALCAGGLLGAALAAGVPAAADVPQFEVVLFPLASVLLTFLFGVTVWKEQVGAPASARMSLSTGVLLLAISLGLLAFGLTRL